MEMLSVDLLRKNFGQLVSVHGTGVRPTCCSSGGFLPGNREVESDIPTWLHVAGVVEDWGFCQ